MWSKIYCGFTHKRIKGNGVQLTVQKFSNTTAEGYALDLRSRTPFSPFIEKMFRGEGCVKRAKEWLEENTA